jgi:hypothetical protein
VFSLRQLRYRSLGDYDENTIDTFGKGRSELQTELDQATSLEQAVKLVQNRLDDLKTIYISDLECDSSASGSLFLDTLRQSIATLTAANNTISGSAPQQTISTTWFSDNGLILKLLQALICVGILVSLFSLTRSAPLAWMTILLLSVLIGVEIAIQLDKDNHENSAGSLMPASVPQLTTIRVDSKILLDNLGDALNTIDRAIAQAEEVKKTRLHQWNRRNARTFEFSSDVDCCVVS